MALRTNKTDTTEMIEYGLINHYHVNRSTRCALEVNVEFGRVDFLAIDRNDIVICIEIKTTLADFKSTSGHNHIGNYNYYAVPTDLVPKIADLVEPHIGIIEVSDRARGEPRVVIVKKSRKVNTKFTKTILDKLKKNMFTALNSNLRRLLRYRYLMKRRD